MYTYDTEFSNQEFSNFMADLFLFGFHVSLFIHQLYVDQFFPDESTEPPISLNEPMSYSIRSEISDVGENKIELLSIL